MKNKEFKFILLCVFLSAFILFSITFAFEGIPVFQERQIAEDTAPLVPASANASDLNKDARPKPVLEISEDDLLIPGVFDVTRPDEKLTTLYDKYFIMGTSDPRLPVFFGEEEIKRPGVRGTFGVLAELEVGENTFTFSQGGNTKTVTIIRREIKPDKSAPITSVTQSSMVPAVFSGVRAGDELEVGCIAPSGAEVTAEFGGRTVTLSQVAEAEALGIPAFYKASVAVGDGYDPQVTQNAGKVTYRMTFHGETKEYTSSGDVYVAGADSAIAVRVTNYLGFVYDDTRDLSDFREKLKRGATDYMRSQDNSYVELSSGGYISKNQVKVIEGTPDVSGTLLKVTPDALEKGESYTFHCDNNPAYLTDLSDERFSVTLFNVAGTPAIDISDSKLFSEVERLDGDHFVTYTFTLKEPGPLWGYNISYGDEGASLLFRYKPVLSQGPRPLSGITVILDAGHGGKDPGALGFAGIDGPTEADVNLSHAKAAGKLLEDMGAKVIHTRLSDTFYSLDYRLRSPEEYGADLFLSIHHNSVLENVDANRVSGLEVYYHTGMSKPLADAMMQGLVSGLGRPERIIRQSYYRVTLSPYSPALLLELGFMSNPLEYERAASGIETERAAKAIFDGIRRALM